MARPQAGKRPPHKAPAKAPQETGGRRSGGNGGGQKKFDDTDRGVLFENDKEGNEARPDVTGKITIKIPDGASAGDVVEFRLAGWKKPYGDGQELLSLLVSLPRG